MNNGGELLSAHISYRFSPNKIIFRDPCKLFPGSLNDIAELLGIPTKDEISHDMIEKEYISQTQWEEFFENNRNAMDEYNLKDALITEKVVDKIKAIMEAKIKIEDNEISLNFYSLVSRSMAARQIWKKTLPENLLEYIYPGKETRIFLPSNPYYMFKHGSRKYFLKDILEEAVVGGRTQCPHGPQEVIDGIQLDARSMYPSVAVEEEYPYGGIIHTDKYVPGKMGLYRVRIKKQTHPNVLPKRVKNKPLDWKFSEYMETWTSNVSIDVMIEENYPHDVLFGFYFMSSTKEYFRSYMCYFYNKRREYKESGDKINEEDVKIKMNALTGSLLQNNFKSFVKIMTNDEQVEFMKKYSKVVRISNVVELDDERFYVTLNPIKLGVEQEHLVPLQEDVCSRCITENPNILTLFILEYARAKLFRMWKLIENVDEGCKMVMTDTDSLLFTNREYVLRRIAEIEEEKGIKILGGNLGQWGIDFYNVLIGFVIRPKFYALRGYKTEKDEEKNTISEKVKVRGVTKKSLVSTNSDQSLFKPFDDGYTQDFNIRSRDYMQILNRIPNVNGIISKEDQEKYLGAKFDHVRNVYNGEYMQVLHFQMRKSFQGVKKKYVVLNMARQQKEEEDDDYDWLFAEDYDD
jgi:hypothetical protein